MHRNVTAVRLRRWGVVYYWGTIVAYLILLTCLIVCLYCGGKMINACLNGVWGGLMLFGRMVWRLLAALTLCAGRCIRKAAPAGLWTAQQLHAGCCAGALRAKQWYVRSGLRQRSRK